MKNFHFYKTIDFLPKEIIAKTQQWLLREHLK